MIIQFREDARVVHTHCRVAVLLRPQLKCFVDKIIIFWLSWTTTIDRQLRSRLGAARPNYRQFEYLFVIPPSIGLCDNDCIVSSMEISWKPTHTHAYSHTYIEMGHAFGRCQRRSSRCDKQINLFWLHKYLLIGTLNGIVLGKSQFDRSVNVNRVKMLAIQSDRLSAFPFLSMLRTVELNAIAINWMNASQLCILLFDSRELLDVIMQLLPDERQTN